MNASLHRHLGIWLAMMLALIAALHAYWALGGKWGLAEALGGADKPVPPVWAIWFVTGLLVAAVLVVLGRVGIWARRVPRWFFTIGCWGVALALLVAALMNFRAHTNWERYGFAPFALALAIGTALVARAPQRAA